MARSVGDSVAPFTLPTDDGGAFSEADLIGKRTVLYFYPKDDTPGCTKEAQAFRDMIEAFQQAGVAVVGVSTDSVASHQKFKAKHGLNFPLLADQERTLAEAFGVWVEKSMYGKKYMGLERASFLIDEAGVVREVWRKVKVPGHADAVLAAAKALG
ncbi:MAG: thioredoxin-dependent thiol peroxidase [Rhodospirillales bacterium]|jgi:peroxiredoxin Q/BCP|nr:thioredoxin-dependent thiol peroxidase [Rhodospirillales bacterium]